jgi:uncharacterized membrane protein
MTSLGSSLKRRFLAGLVVLVPGIITISAIVWLFNFVDRLLGRGLDEIIGGHIPGLGFLAAVLLVLTVGFVSTNVFGRKVIASLEMVFLRIPVFKGFYTAVKQLVDAFSPDNKSSFKEFVIVEYPRKGCFAFGFLTNDSTVVADRQGIESRMRAVYIPTNNLYLGEVALFREEDVIYTEIEIEEGIKTILSGGIAAPARIVEAKR